ncbi:sulfurtransferase TusA family protein [Gymnodinialimonas sp. 2305UL16-5]|uniref:sulfurtransferase TusA family protein n=1 Tax=Gymnodinialimonas mytili TaxID=3126503 RepID=UPI0030976DD2
MTDPLQIDARDLLCPLPVLRLRKALASVAPGSQVQLLATDPASQIDVPHFCTEQGHHLIRQTTSAEGHFLFTIAKAL